MMNGFNPQKFITTSNSNNVNDDYFEEEEKKGPSKFIGNYGLLFYGYYQKLNQIISYEQNKKPRIVPFKDKD